MVEQRGSNPWPPHCETDSRQKRKLLPFRKLQHRRKIRVFLFFLIPYHRIYRSRAVIFGHVWATWEWGEPLSYIETVFNPHIAPQYSSEV